MSVGFRPSQLATSSPSNNLIPWNGDPTQLLWSDLKLMLKCFATVPGILRPFHFGKEASMWDELYPSAPNMACLFLHIFLVFAQLAFIFSLPFLLFLPGYWALGIIFGFLIMNWIVCHHINGSDLIIQPSVDVKFPDAHEKEFWIFLNGVSVGATWLQSNVDRLSLTFGRRVIGVHNTTDGIIFDLIQCLVQRNFNYSTADIRRAYIEIKSRLLKKEFEKVVFILHSQGGIEGSMIIDWLLAELPQDCMQKLEVYTFGNAANHFSNPIRGDKAPQTDTSTKPRETTATNSVETIANGTIPPTTITSNGTADPTTPATPAPPAKSDKPHASRRNAIRHIEHYANAGDFVAQFGVLNYSNCAHRFMGRVFVSPTSGHLLNQHYLHNMFPLTKDSEHCADVNEFMEMDVEIAEDKDDYQYMNTSRLWSVGDSDGPVNGTRSDNDIDDDSDQGNSSGDNATRAKAGKQREGVRKSFIDKADRGKLAYVGDKNSPITPIKRTWSVPQGGGQQNRPLKVKDFSRLWLYRNGASPSD